MKCNHCKKIIPNGEEVIISKKYLHEECIKPVEEIKWKEKKEEYKKC